MDSRLFKMVLLLALFILFFVVIIDYKAAFFIKVLFAVIAFAFVVAAYEAIKDKID